MLTKTGCRCHTYIREVLRVSFHFGDHSSCRRTLANTPNGQNLELPNTEAKGTRLPYRFFINKFDSRVRKPRQVLMSPNSSEDFHLPHIGLQHSSQDIGSCIESTESRINQYCKQRRTYVSTGFTVMKTIT